MSKAELSKKLDLDRIIFIGRTWDEYRLMFNLSEADLVDRRILDCPAGSCSFTAVSRQQGVDVTACDVAYYYSVEQLEKKGFQDIDHAVFHMEKTTDNYLWDYFKNISELKQARTRTLTDFVLDLKRLGAEDRYVPSTLPVLPFSGEQFDLTLSGHFLFSYADRLDLDFHKQTILEFMRVTKEEIRIFPLVDLAGQMYEDMEQLIEWVNDQGWVAEKVAVPYEFQKKANTMLKLNRLR
jgi:hypothetical protein